MKMLSWEVWRSIGDLHEPEYDTAMIPLKQNKSHHFYIEYRNDRCRHNAVVRVSALPKEYGEDITSDEELGRARCTKYGFQGNNQMRPVYVGKSSIAQTGSAVNKDSTKYIESVW